MAKDRENEAVLISEKPSVVPSFPSQDAPPSLASPEAEKKKKKSHHKKARSLSGSKKEKESKTKSRTTKVREIEVTEPSILTKEPESEEAAARAKLAEAAALVSISLPVEVASEQEKKKKKKKDSFSSPSSSLPSPSVCLSPSSPSLPDPSLDSSKPKHRHRKHRSTSDNSEKSLCSSKKSSSSSSTSSSKSKGKSKTSTGSSSRRRRAGGEEEEEGSDGEYSTVFRFENEEERDEEYSCLDESEIIARQADTVHYIQDILSVDSSVAIAVLQAFKWNKDRLLSSYLEDPSRVLREAGILSPSSSSSSSSSSVDIQTLSVSSPVLSPASSSPLDISLPPLDQTTDSTSSSSPSTSSTTSNTSSSSNTSCFLPFTKCEVSECSVCGEELTEDNGFALSTCGHWFCEGCWDMYLSQKINEGQAVYVNCPHFKCVSLVPDLAVLRLVDDVTYRKFTKFRMNSFVEDSAHLKWCPAPDCGRVITSDMISRKVVSCLCGHVFCFQCGQEDHMPATCEQMRQWKRKCEDESETNNWIAANTKDCPKCNLPTEKNGGCNHMTCRHCKYEYCWVCMKDWKGHNGYYVCSKTEKKKLKSRSKSKRKEILKEEEKRLEMKLALDRYIDHFDRFSGYANNPKFLRAHEDALFRVDLFLKSEATTAEVKFLRQAASLILECQSFLKYGMVLFYYLEDKDPLRELYVYMHKELEEHLDQLIEALENPMVHRTRIVTLSEIILTRISNFSSAVEADL